jgi:Transposase
VRETGKPIAQVARELGVHEGTLGHWCAWDRRGKAGDEAALMESERQELIRLRKENAELVMLPERDDQLAQRLEVDFRVGHRGDGEGVTQKLPGLGQGATRGQDAHRGGVPQPVRVDPVDPRQIR